MTTRNMLLSAAAGLGLAAMTATAALAGSSPSAESLTDPKIGPAKNEVAAALGTQNTIVVEADNLDWAHAKPTNLSLPFHVEVKTTKKKWDIDASHIIVGLAPITSAGVVGSCCGQLEEFTEYNFATKVDHDPNTGHVDQDGWWTLAVTDDHMGTRARNACRNLRKDLEKQGLKQDQIFGQDRNTTLPTDFRYVARVVYPRATGEQEFFWKQSQPTWANINVICKKRDGLKVSVNPNVKPSVDDVSVGFQVTQAALAITPKPYEGRCPAKIHLAPTIQTNGKGTVKYRFVDQFGNKSQEFQVKFDKADIKFLDHVIEIDDKDKKTGLGFTAQPAQGGELGLAAPTVPHLNQGIFRMEITSPHKKLSNIADYSVKCTFSTAGDGEIAAPKDTVNPVVVGGLVSGLADLTIDSVQPSPAVPTKLFIKITNKGTAASTPTNLKAIRWTGNQATVRGTSVPAVLPGQSQVILAELGGTIDGATKLFVRVDDPNRIPEGNEMNNSFTVK